MRGSWKNWSERAHIRRPGSLANTLRHWLSLSLRLSIHPSIHLPDFPRISKRVVDDLHPQRCSLLIVHWSSIFFPTFFLGRGSTVRSQQKPRISVRLAVSWAAGLHLCSPSRVGTQDATPQSIPMSLPVAPACIPADNRSSWPVLHRSARPRSSPSRARSVPSGAPPVPVPRWRGLHSMPCRSRWRWVSFPRSVSPFFCRGPPRRSTVWVNDG